MKVNYHMHTNCSDGGRTAKELVEMAKAAGVSSMSVTDHNTVSGTREAADLAKRAEIHYVSGVELSTVSSADDGFPTRCAPHILGYGFNVKKMQLFIKNIEDNCLEVIKNLIYDLRQDGFCIYEQNILPNRNLSVKILTRYAVAEQLVLCGYAETVDNAFANILNTKPYNKHKVIKLTVACAIDAIHNAGGYAFWAHPQQVVSVCKKAELSFEKIEEVANKMKSYGLDGIEAYYQDFSAKTTEFLIALTKKLKLKASVGTDFHDEKALYGADFDPTYQNRNQLYYKKDEFRVLESVINFFATLGDGCGDN